MSVLGTRPEVIKIKELKRILLFLKILCVTAQHRQMFDNVLALLGFVQIMILTSCGLDRPEDLYDLSCNFMLGIKGLLAPEDEYHHSLIER